MLEHLPSAVGHAIRGIRAGLEETAYHDEGLEAPETITLESSAFADEGRIPKTFTLDGEGISPSLSWRGVPSEAQSLVLIVEDADSPTPMPLVHALVWDLAPRDNELPAGALASPHHIGDIGSMGLNAFRKAEYLPPDPPPGHGPHRYEFQLFALDRRLEFARPPLRDVLVHAMWDHVIAKAVLIGVYERD
jgi:Raf kinase inhibitor-like YbhB/YbcL family protein